MFARTVAGFLLLSCVTPLLGQDMARVVRESAERSREKRLAEIATGEKVLSGCPYVLTQVDLPPAVTGTPFVERIHVMTPCNYDPLGPPVPLIVAWNGWGLSALSFFNGMTGIPDEANARGWLVVSVTCIDDQSYGWIVGQQNVAAAIDYVVANYAVDQDRIYMVGWSAGGGSSVSYAARHLDPAKPMVAALATDAGSYDLVNTFQNVPFAVQSIMMHPALFQGPPTGGFLFNYLRTETIAFDAQSSAVLQESSQARNLRHVPVYHVYSSDDVLAYLATQSDWFASHLQSVGADVTTTVFSGLPSTHSWDLLDPVSTLDFLAQHVVEREPAEFDVLADRDATYYWADVVQRTGGSFSSVGCAADPGTQTLQLYGITNVASLRLRPPAADFDPNADFALEFSGVDGLPTTIVLEGVTEAPTYVVDGFTQLETWTHDPALQELTFELPGTSHELAVRFDAYTATITGPAQKQIGGGAALQLQANTPSAAALLLIGLAPGVIPIALSDPADDRHLLVGAAPLPILLFLTLDPAGAATLAFGLPNDPALVGTTLHCQFLTFPGTSTLVDEISNRHDLEIVAPAGGP